MEFSAGEIAQLLQGSVEGDPEVKVNDISKIEEGRPGTLTFLANLKYQEHIYDTGASIALVNADWKAERDLPNSLTLIRVADAYSSLATLLDAYNKSQRVERHGIESSAVIHESAQVADDAYIGANCVIGPNSTVSSGAAIMAGTVIHHDCSIGEKTRIESNCTIYDQSEIGKECIIHAGVVIGADGFGFAPRGSGYDKVPQIGKVIIEDFVEIGANTCIDRATIGATVIKEGVKLDNLIQVAHNVVIGENTVIAAQTGIAGSTKIGKNCMIGGQVGIIGHIEIADEVKIAAQSGIGHAIPEKGTIMQGSPAIANRDFKRAYVNFVKLPDLKERIVKLEKRLDSEKDL
ncbi:MAG: UDP-3-O-(3-hydroxymyristoyl)glucosamine N-acyltransferase [Flavobacteriales bacterium]|nr:UDP-3-O-(3-hydroxymyristoyl)glucosamine N-acyltransferase [Flavobacteriales bacterium]